MNQRAVYKMAVLLLLVFAPCLGSAFKCPLKLETLTLTMSCSAACPDHLSPCLYYKRADKCKVDINSNSVCVIGTDGDCAVECLSPISGDKNESWNLMITTEKEYVRDVVDAKNRSTSFRIAKKSFAKLDIIADLAFPLTAETVYLTGNALPIIDRIVDFPVIYRGEIVDVDLYDYGFLKMATEVKAMYIENLNLTTLTTFPLLSNLEILDMANTMLTAMPTGIESLPAIKRLDLSMNKFVLIKDNTLPTTLESLYLSDCSLEAVPSDLLLMPNLKALDLSSNPLLLPPADSLPLGLERLSWWGLYHKRLPEDFAKMTNLRYLELGWSDFSDAATLELLPPSLNELRMRETMLSEIPTSLSRLQELTVFDAPRNFITLIPTGRIPVSVTSLNLSLNYIEKVESPSALPHTLVTLDLSTNSLRSASFPSDFHEQTPTLTHLYLHSNYLEVIPPPVFQLRFLKVLTLHKNGNMSSSGSSRMTLTTEQVDFLSQLTTFTIDLNVFETNCDMPMLIGSTEFSVCRTGDPSIRIINESGDNPSGRRPGMTGDGGMSTTSIVLAVVGSVGGLIAVIGGVMYWKRRQAAANATMDLYSGKADSFFFAMNEDEMDVSTEIDGEYESILEGSETTEYADIDALTLLSMKKQADDT